MSVQRFISCLVIVVSLSLLAAGSTSAQARNSISLRSGSFTPWRGTTGTASSFQYTRVIGERHHLGFEFTFRDFEGKVDGVLGLDVEQYILSLSYRADLLLESPVTPYLGFGLGPGVNAFSQRRVEDAINRRSPGSDFDVVTAAVVDFTGIAGVDVVVPSTEWLTLFGEARFSHTMQFTNFEDKNVDRPLNLSLRHDVDKTSRDHAGGVSVQAGLRFRF